MQEIEGKKTGLSSVIDRIPPYVMLTIAVTGAIVTSAGAYFTLGSDIRTLSSWRIEHLEHHRDRAAELAAIEGQVAEAIASVQKEATETRRRTDELTFRLGAAEENARRTGEAITALQQSVNAQASDIRVMREILERLDERRAAVEATRLARRGQ